MLEMRITAVSFDERDLVNLERIITDADEKESFLFLKKMRLRPYFAFSAGETQISSGFC